MTTEEKAKAYDEAIEKLRSLHDDYDTVSTLIDIKEELEHIFPLLKESEDEKARKEITELVMQPTWKTEKEFHRRKELCAWLEKQGEKGTNGNEREFPISEQKSADKVEPKFKVGDWVMFNNKHQSIYQVEKIENGYYILRHTHGGTFKVCVLHDESLRLWTIQDAKDGDVLACKDEILLFKSYSAQNRISLYCWYNVRTNNFHNKEVADASLTTRNKICQATKEQRDLLFQKMKEAGYEWDAEKKELKKIEQKSAQSEKDAENISMLIDLVESKEESMEVKIELSTWLNSLKERVQPQLKQGEKGTNGNEKENPFLEQKPCMMQWKGDNLKEVIDFVGKDKNFDKWFKSFEEYEQYVQEHGGIFKLFNADGSHYEVPIGAWIVKAPDGYNVASKATFIQNPAWDEEDEKIYSRIYDLIHAAASANYDVDEDGKELGEYAKITDWLKSIKDRVGNFDDGYKAGFSAAKYNQWKPSDEQIHYLSWIANIKLGDSVVEQEVSKHLNELCEDLKKLMEEKV